jgi:luciferase family oxidoreductase group 1
VLDLCKRSASVDARESLQGTISLAIVAEKLGYKRYWIAEHHTDDAAQSSPEVLLPLLASQTKSIRIGAGGILLPYYSPLKVAELFLVLEALFPGRIDLGICRGPGITNPEVARALVSGHDDELVGSSFEIKADMLIKLMRNTSNGGRNRNELSVFPVGVPPPPIWVLGAGEGSVRLAVSLRTPYAYSMLFGGGLSHGLDFMAQYRRDAVTGSAGDAPQALIAVSVICADTESRAREYDAELVQQGCYKSNIVGTTKQCADTLKLFASLFDVSEIILTTFVQHPNARQDLYTRLAEQLHLR